MRLIRYAPAVLALACASASHHRTTAPVLYRVPPPVVEAFCAKLRAEGIASDAPISVLRHTRPIITGASLRSLGHLYGRDGELGAAAQALTATLPPMPIDFGDSTSCSWSPIDAIDAIAHSQATIVEFSAPFVNPFTKGESGVLVRMSIGGHDAQWYWVPLAERDGNLGIGLVLPMDMHDA